MKKHPLWPFFFIALFFALYSTAFFPRYTFLPFAPFLVIACNRLPLLKSLWIATCCGLTMDLLSHLTPLGFHALNDMLVMLYLYRFRLYFIEKTFSVSSFTFIFSFLSTLQCSIFLKLLGTRLSFTWQGALTDFFLMPLLDSLYAFLWFSCPLLLLHFFRRHWFRFLFFKKEAKRKGSTG